MSAERTLLGLLLVPLAFVAPGAFSQNEPAQVPSAARASTFSTGQLEQMAAPIALYPDALMMQILMAATYPLEVVEADRWIRATPDLAGAALEEALKQHEWDPSVKSLCGFPTVLKQMSDNLDWTRDLGDAFLGQKDGLLDAIQGMRQKAYQAGNLKTTEQQTVAQDGDAVVIESANPEVIYVPTYSPLVVYGPSWSYPYWYYPYFYGPPGPGFGFVTFGFGFAWGFGLWGGCDWHHHFVHVDEGHFNNFNSHTSTHPGTFHMPNSGGRGAEWTHDPEHRKGVGYKNTRVAQQFGAGSGVSRITRDQARGFDRSRGMNPTPLSPAGPKTVSPSPGRGAGGQPSSPPSERGSQRPAPPSNAGKPRTPSPVAPPPSGGRQRPAPASTVPRPSSPPRGALSGFRNPSFDRSASSRGSASRASKSAGSGGRRRVSRP